MSEKLNESFKVQTRIEWLDIAKGLGVLLVVLGHLWYNCSFSIVNQIIYTFHMPMFFILSGFVFKKGSSNFGSFLMAKIKRLLLPTFIFFVLGSIYLFSINQSFKSIITDFFFLYGFCPYTTPCWYFISLFQILVLSYFLNLDKLSFILKGIVACLAFALGLIIYKFDIFIPFGIDRTIIAMSFFTVGAMLRQAYNENKKIPFPFLEILIKIIILVIWVFSGIVFNKKVSFFRLVLGNYFLFVISGICGSIIIIELSKLLQKTKLLKRFFSKTADNSILIIGTHYFIIYLLFENIMKDLGLFGTWQYCFIVLCFSIIAISIYNYIGKFLKKHFPAITGHMR